MSIDPNALASSENQFVLAEAAEPVGRAVVALEHAQGNGWWHLVVEMGAGRYAAVRFDDLAPLAESGGAGFFRRPLGDLVGDGIPEATTVEQADLETNQAKDLALDSPGHLVVVTHQGVSVGILHVGMGVFEHASLMALFGQFKQRSPEEYALWEQQVRERAARADGGETP